MPTLGSLIMIEPNYVVGVSHGEFGYMYVLHVRASFCCCMRVRAVSKSRSSLAFAILRSRRASSAA